jgi:hypothetical protein
MTQDELGKAVEETLRSLGKEWYEERTSEEIANIKICLNTTSILYKIGDNIIIGSFVIWSF